MKYALIVVIFVTRVSDLKMMNAYHASEVFISSMELVPQFATWVISKM
jgi:hypothetical protein